MGSHLDKALAAEMARWEAGGLRRVLERDDPDPGRVDFTSNDYLGLSGHPEVIAAAHGAIDRFGAGGKASRLLGGGSPLHEEAERAAAEWLGAEAALLFPSGYQANVGIVCSLVGRGDVLFSDERNHASLIDAARLSRARVHVYRHLDLDELARDLAGAGSARRRLVLTEGIFSMDGDRAPLGELAALCAHHDAELVVDEAHAAGLLGPAGSGAWNALGAERTGDDRLAARIVTGGKALGVTGAFVVSSRAVRDHLINHARTFIYTTAPSPAVAGALIRAIELCRCEAAPREAALACARALAESLGLPPPPAAIVPLFVGDTPRALDTADKLRRSGFEVRAIRPPTVPEGTARLRLVCHAWNSAAEVEELARTLLGALPSLASTLGASRSPAPSLGALPSLTPTHPGETGPGTERLRVAPGKSEVAPTLFVVGTDTGIGKTVVSALLLRAARGLGEARYWKAVQTGEESDSEVVARLAAAEPHEILRPAWSLSLPASPHEAAAAAGVEIDPQRLAGGLESMRRLVPEARVVVELAGGLFVPYRGGFTQADWLERAALPIVLVARSGLGTLNHTLLTLEALRARHLEPRALFLVGEPHPSNRETLHRLGHLQAIHELPTLDPLDTAALDGWLGENDVTPLLSP